MQKLIAAALPLSLFSLLVLAGCLSNQEIPQPRQPILPGECAPLSLPERDDCISYNAFLLKNPSLCNLSSSPATRFFCITAAAAATKNNSLCSLLTGNFTETAYSPESPIPCLLEVALTSRNESACEPIQYRTWRSYCHYRLALRTNRSELCSNVIPSYDTDTVYSEELFATNLREYCFARLTPPGSGADCSRFSDESSRTICSARANLNLSECEKNIFPLWNVECVIGIASYESNPSLCSRIDAPPFSKDWALLCSAAVKKDASECGKIETQHVRDGCYSDIAKVTGSSRTCFLMKTYLDKLSCLKEIQ